MNLLLDLATTLPLDQLALDSSLFQGLGQSLAVLPTFEDVTGILQSMNLYAVWAACFGVLLLCGFGLPIPEDITLVLCGYMTWMLGSDGSYGNPNVLVALAIAMGLAGVLLGDAIMFTLGQRYGKYLMVRWPFASILGSGRKELAEGFLKEKGRKCCFRLGLCRVCALWSSLLRAPWGLACRPSCCLTVWRRCCRYPR